MVELDRDNAVSPGKSDCFHPAVSHSRAVIFQVRASLLETAYSHRDPVWRSVLSSGCGRKLQNGSIRWLWLGRTMELTFGEDFPLA